MSPREMTPEQLLDAYERLLLAPVDFGAPQGQADRRIALRAEILRRLWKLETVTALINS